jgi:hypothetical protein
MKADDAKRLKELEWENTRLKRIVADQALDIDMLKGLPTSGRLGDRPTQRGNAGERRPHYGGKLASHISEHHSAQRPRFAG